MGKRNKRYEEEERAVECQVCENIIPLEFYIARGDMLCCDECGAEYIIKSRNPIRILLLDEEFDEDENYPDSFDDDLFDDRQYE